MARHDTEATPVAFARGTVGDRPWGATLGSFLIDGRSGQLTLTAANGTQFAIAFTHGLVVGASSPLAIDSVARIAQSERLITAQRVGELARARGAAVRDELTSFVDAAELAPAQVRRLKRRVLLQRAAHTFAVEVGTFEIGERISIPTLLGTEVDVCAVIYHGAHLNLDGERLNGDLGKLGTRFELTADAAEVARFELGDAEKPVLDALRGGTTIPEIEAACRELDPRMIQAVIYALAVCGAVTRIDDSLEIPVEIPFDATEPTVSRVPTPHEPTLSRARTPTPHQPNVSRTRPPTPNTPTVTRVPTRREPTMSCVPMIIRTDPEVVVRPSEAPPRQPTRAMTDPFIEVRATSIRPNALDAAQVRALIVERRELVERGVDHFTLLGVPVGASIEAVRAAYVELARNLRSERLIELGLRDPGFHARSLFAQVCIAYTVLTDPVRRAGYIAGLWHSGAALDP